MNPERRSGRGYKDSTRRRPTSSSRVQRLVDQHNAEIDRRPAVPESSPRVPMEEKRVRFRLPRLPIRSNAEATLARMMEQLGLEDARRGRASRCRECSQRVE